MKAQWRIVVVAIGALLGALPESARLQMAAPKASDLFQTAKPGQWVELEGVVQKDFTVIAKKVKFLTGDFQEDDWELKAAVRTIDRTNKQFNLLLIPIKVSAKTEYENAAGTFKQFEDLKIGMLVECEGTFLKDGCFAAEEVQEESDFKPEEPGELRAVGKIEKLDPRQHTVTVFGVKFKIIEATKIQSALK